MSVEQSDVPSDIDITRYPYTEIGRGLVEENSISITDAMDDDILVDLSKERVDRMFSNNPETLRNGVIKIIRGEQNNVTDAQILMTYPMSRIFVTDIGVNAVYDAYASGEARRAKNDVLRLAEDGEMAERGIGPNGEWNAEKAIELLYGDGVDIDFDPSYVYDHSHDPSCSFNPFDGMVDRISVDSKFYTESEDESTTDITTFADAFEDGLSFDENALPVFEMDEDDIPINAEIDGPMDRSYCTISSFDLMKLKSKYEKLTSMSNSSGEVTLEGDEANLSMVNKQKPRLMECYINTEDIASIVEMTVYNRVREGLGGSIPKSAEETVHEAAEELHTDIREYNINYPIETGLYYEAFPKCMKVIAHAISHEEVYDHIDESEYGTINGVNIQDFADDVDISINTLILYQSFLSSVSMYGDEFIQTIDVDALNILSPKNIVYQQRITPPVAKVSHELIGDWATEMCEDCGSESPVMYYESVVNENDYSPTDGANLDFSDEGKSDIDDESGNKNDGTPSTSIFGDIE